MPCMLVGRVPYGCAAVGADPRLAISGRGRDNNKGCDYSSGNINNLSSTWSQWTSGVTATNIFLGVPASTAAAGSGYIPPNVLTSQVLPVVKTSSKYGGIMVWNRYFDEMSNYSATVKSSV